MQLYEEIPPEQVKERFRHFPEGVGSLEIAKVEQELVSEGISREELRRVIEVAVEYRQRVRDWIHKVDPGEFPKEKLVVTVRD